MKRTMGKAKNGRTVLIAGIVLLACFSLFFPAGCSRRMKSDGDFMCQDAESLEDMNQ